MHVYAAFMMVMLVFFALPMLMFMVMVSVAAFLLFAIFMFVIVMMVSVAAFLFFALLMFVIVMMAAMLFLFEFFFVFHDSYPTILSSQLPSSPVALIAKTFASGFISSMPFTNLSASSLLTRSHLFRRIKFAPLS